MISVAVQLLCLTADVLATPEQWIKGASRRDRHGKKSLFSGDAVAWCLGGAFMCAMDQIPRTNSDVKQANALLHRAVKGMTGKEMHFVNYNDEPDTTFVDIKNLLRIAVELGVQDDDVSCADDRQAGQQLPDGVSGAD